METIMDILYNLQDLAPLFGLALSLVVIDAGLLFK